MKRVLVTGGAGFIGSHLVEALVRRGDRVRVLDDFSTGRRENLAGLLPQIELIEGDLRDPQIVAQAAAGVELVYHQAAMVSVPASAADPLTCEAINVGGTLQLLLAAREAGVRRIVYASSCAVYGEPATVPLSEEAPTRPNSPYGLSKLAAELYLRMAPALWEVETVALRYFNVYGPRQDPHSPYAAVVPLFITAMLEGRQVTIHGDGGQSRDFVYVEDVVRANLLAGEAAGGTGHAYNIASGERHTVSELAGELQALLGSTLDPVHSAPRAGDIRHSWADVERARDRLGFAAQVSFEDGLRRTAAWYEALHIAPRPVEPGT